MILVDTTPLVALFSPNDPLHDRACRELLLVEREQLAVCEPVLTELMHLAPRADVRRAIRDALVAWDVRLVRLADERSLDAVFGFLNRYAEHVPDFADAYLVALSQQIRRAKVWTFDREVQHLWRRADGTAVPLVRASRR